MAESKTSARNLQRAERAERILQMRLAGMTYEMIGKAEHINPGVAYRIIKCRLDGLRAKCAESAEQVRDMMVRRMEILRERLWQICTEAKPDLQSIDRVLKIEERIAALLGVNAPAESVMSLRGDGSHPVRIYVGEKPDESQDETT